MTINFYHLPQKEKRNVYLEVSLLRWLNLKLRGLEVDYVRFRVVLIQFFM